MDSSPPSVASAGSPPNEEAPAAPTPAIRIADLSVTFGEVRAVQSLSLEVHRGEVFGFVGPNGAGKTTTMRSLLDLLRPDGGTIEVLGHPVRQGSGPLRAHIGYLPGDLPLFPFLTGRDTLDLFARLRGRDPVRRDPVIDHLGFPRAALERKVRTYSTGMRQSLGIVSAFQHDPDLLVLDEPTTGLDPVVRGHFLELTRQHAERGKTVFLSSHVLAEVEDCAQRVALIHKGKLRLVDTVAGLRETLPRTVNVLYKDGRRETFSHTGSPSELAARLDFDHLADLEVRAADLTDVFKATVDAVKTGKLPKREGD